MFKRVPPFSWALWVVSRSLLAFARWATICSVRMAPYGASVSIAVVHGETTWAKYWHRGRSEQLLGMGLLCLKQGEEAFLYAELKTEINRLAGE